MAEMIPESISINQSATPGEKRIFKLFQDALLPDEDYIVWYEPRILDRYTDFIIWSQYFGMLVIEVKDWIISQIHEYNPLIMKGTFYDNLIKEVINPLQSARNVHNKLKNILIKIPSLVNQEGDYKNHIKFPIGYCSIFTNISQKQAEEKGLLNNQILGYQQTLFSDDIKIDIDNNEERRLLISKLRQAVRANVKFDFDPLSYQELKILRYEIFPEIRVNIEKIRRLRTIEDEEKLKTLDLEQERTAKSLGEGHRILKGVAGSGKTLVLACRAKYLNQIHPDWKILVLCYNISLRKYLEKLIEVSGITTNANKIEVTHFHSLVSKLTKVDLSIKPEETEDKYDSRVGDILKGKIAEGIIKNGIYDAILIDEGQDFVTEWMQGISQLLNKNSDSLLFCYDPSQNVFGKKKPNWKTAGFKVQGKKPIELKKSYRNTIEILSVARLFAKIQAQVNIVSEDILDNVLFPEIATERHGDFPLLIKVSTNQDLIEHILNSIDYYIKNNECNFSEIGILYTAEDKNFQFEFIEKFSYKFESKYLYTIIPYDRTSKMKLDVSSNQVKLMPLESSKGLEFRVVFLLGIDSMPRIKRDEISERAFTYVGMTRAQDYLYIYFHDENIFIKEIEEAINHIKKINEDILKLPIKIT